MASRSECKECLRHHCPTRHGARHPQVKHAKRRTSRAVGPAAAKRSTTASSVALCFSPSPLPIAVPRSPLCSPRLPRRPCVCAALSAQRIPRQSPGWPTRQPAKQARPGRAPPADCASLILNASVALHTVGNLRHAYSLPLPHYYGTLALSPHRPVQSSPGPTYLSCRRCHALRLMPAPSFNLFCSFSSPPLICPSPTLRCPLLAC